MKLGTTSIVAIALLVIATAHPAHSQERADLWWPQPTASSASRISTLLPENRLALLPNATIDITPRPKLPSLPLHAYRLPGEFERQAALLVACCELVTEVPDVFADIVEAVGESLEIIALVNGQSEIDCARAALQPRRIRGERIRFVQIPHNTMWARDYGPSVVQADGKASIVDAIYGEVIRPEDDQVPGTLAAWLNLPVLRAPIRLEGGNLLSNGQGVCLTTEMLIHANAGRVDESQLRGWLKQLYGGKQTVFLEPLVGESTAHVDMFATFTSPDTVVVGAYDPVVDPENAEILDRNAERLSEVMVDDRNLQVVRITMPPHDDGLWRTYTNVVFANGVLLVPVYLDVDEQGRQEALETYAQLLPGWRIVGVDAGRLIQCAGALHCITLNLGPLARIPFVPLPVPDARPDETMLNPVEPIRNER